MHLIQQYKGPIIHAMPTLLNDGLLPPTIEDILVGRMQGTFSEDQWYDSGICNVIDTKDNLKIIPRDPHFLRQYVHPNATVIDGAIQIHQEEWDRLPTIGSFTSKEVEKYANKRFTRQEAKENPFWKVFLSDEVRNDVIDYTFSRLKSRFEYTSGMGIWLVFSRKFCALRMFGVLEQNYHSRIDGYYHVNGPQGNLIGLNK